MRIRTVETDFEYQVKEMVAKFIKHYKEDIDDSESNVSDYIWENKEEFGEIVFNHICEYFGDEILFETLDEVEEEE